MKREMLAAALVTVVFTIVSGPAASAAEPGVRPNAALTGFHDWPLYHADTKRSGVSPETAIGDSSSAGLGAVWTTTVGGQIFASPAVATSARLHKTLVYIANRGGIGVPSHIFAYDASSGNLIWSHILGGYVQDSPAVFGGFVYVGSSTHNLYVYNANNGHLVCKFATTGQVSSSPMVANPDGTGPVVFFGDSGVSGGQADGGNVWAVTGAGNAAGPCHLKWKFNAFGSPPGSATGQAGNYSSPAYTIDGTGRPLLVFGT